jgi:hypothetical protein
MSSDKIINELDLGDEDSEEVNFEEFTFRTCLPILPYINFKNQINSYNKTINGVRDIQI